MLKPYSNTLVTISHPNCCQPKKLPKPLVAVFVLIQLFLGINYGFFATVTDMRMRALANLTSVINFLLLTTACFYNILNNWDWIRALLFVVHYLCVFITMRFSKYTIYNFFRDLTAIDAKINYEMNSFIGWKTLVFLSLAFCFKIGLSVLFCFRIACFNESSVFFIMFVTSEMIIILPFLLTSVNILIFNGIQLRLRFLKAVFQEKKLQIKEIEMVYKALADCMSKIRVSQDIIIVLGFAEKFMICVGMVWFQLKILKDDPNLLTAVLIITNSLILIIHICLPAVNAEMVGVQIDEIKFLAHERLLVENDADNSEELLHLLRYVEARPLTDKACRLVPVDLRLPVLLLSMSATYLVVLVQLTHLY